MLITHSIQRDVGGKYCIFSLLSGQMTEIKGLLNQRTFFSEMIDCLWGRVTFFNVNGKAKRKLCRSCHYKPVTFFSSSVEHKTSLFIHRKSFFIIWINSSQNIFLISCSTLNKSYWFGTTNSWLNCIFFFFWWTISLKSFFFSQFNVDRQL